MEKKITQKDMFNEVIALASANGREDIVKFAEERIAALDKKSANRKPSKNQTANEEIKAKKNNVKHYERSTKPRDKPTRERKIDTEKLEILEKIKVTLENCGFAVSREREVALHFGDYELKLIRHKKK